MSKSESIPEEMLSAYLDGELTSDERRTVEVALESDSELRALLTEFEQLRNEIQSLPRYQLDEAFAHRVTAAAEQSENESTNVGAKSVRDRAARDRTLNQPRTYQSRLRFVVGMAAAAAAIFVACWAMFPNGDQGIAKVSSVPDEREQRTTKPQATDLAVDDDLSIATDADELEAYAIPENRMGGTRGGMDGTRGRMGGMGGAGFGGSNPVETDSFGVLPMQMGEALDEQVQRFQEPQDSPRFHAPPKAALAQSPSVASLEAKAANASSAPGTAAPAASPQAPSLEALADAAPPAELKENTRTFRGASGGRGASNAASLPPTRLARKKASSSVDAVLYLASADSTAYAFRMNEASPTQRSSASKLSYRKLDLSDPKQRLDIANEQLRRLAGIASMENFAGIEIPTGSELVMLEGTPEQVQTALTEAGVKAQYVKIMNSNAELFASNLKITSASPVESLGLEQASIPRSRSMQRTLAAPNPKKSQASAQTDSSSDEISIGEQAVDEQADTKLGKAYKAKGTKAESGTVRPDAQDKEAEQQEDEELQKAIAPKVRVLLVLPTAVSK